MTTLTERFLTVLGLMVMAVVSGLAVEVWLGLRSGEPFGHTQAGHLVGWAGFAVTLLVFVYPYQKRRGPKTAWPKGWFWVHQVAGVIGPVLILVHAGPHFHALVPLLALLAMAVVVVSGVVGVAAHRKAVRLLREERGQLLGQGLSAEAVEDRLYELAAGEEAFRVWQIIHTPMVAVFVVLATAHVAGALYFGGW
jgi:hypothetical protein